MCGIFGIAGGDLTDPSRRSVVARMAQRIIHRGPDGEGIHSAPGIAFGMRRLSIIDLEGGQQPLSSEDGNVWVVCNGEIYNFRSLRAELLERGHRFKTGSDAEVIVHLYEELGEGFLDRLKGMFGLAVWDGRRRSLLIARDRMGMKPVYYSLQGDTLIFGSEAKSILATGLVETRCDEGSLEQYLRLGYAIAPTTPFRGMQKLAPAECLQWQDGRTKRWSYWSPPSTVGWDASRDELVDATATAFRRAVENHMVSDVPVGAFLSGGIDSGAIVGTMSSLAQAPVQTFSVGYAGGSVESYYNELPAAREISTRFGTAHTEILVQPDLVALLPQLIYHIEEPLCDTASLTTAMVSKLASQSVKVIMSGVGGDEIFAGYRRYLGHRYAAAYSSVPAWLRRAIRPLVMAMPVGRQSRILDMVRYARGFVAGDGLPWQEQYLAYVQTASRETVSALLGCPVGEPSAFLRAAEQADCADPLLRLFRLDWQTQLSEQLLLLTDKVTMAYSIECRAPFLDDDLIGFASRIPHAMKMPAGRLKGLFKDAMAPLLPQATISRRKRGFGAPFGHWLKGQLKPMRDALLSDEALRRRQILDRDAVRSVLAEHDAGTADHSDLLFVLVCFEIWARLFLDGRSHEDVAAELGASIVAKGRV